MLPLISFELMIKGVFIGQIWPKLISKTISLGGKLHI
jgi:hypothetical protein